MDQGQFNALKGNIFGGLTAAVVALPLALAFGVASQAGAIAGLYGAILVGFFAAVFGGTPTQISGPTGPMTVVMTSIITIFMAEFPENGMALAFTTVMLGGFCQIVLGYFKLGRFINLVPYPVVSGFMSGIGLIIILLQLIPFLGSTITAQSPHDVLLQLPEILETTRQQPLLLGSLLLLVIFLWPRSWSKWIPESLFALILGTVVSVVFFEVSDLERIGEIPSGIPELHLPIFSISALLQMLKYGLILGVLGSIDSLLTSLVADNMDRSEHDSDKELIGQGIGNLISGLFGGLPGAGATMRTVVNIRAGGTSRLSGVVHALTLILMVVLGSPIVSQIPHAVLAAILIKVGIDIIDWRFLRRVRNAPIQGVIVMFLVLGLTVFVSLVIAVAAGVLLTSLFVLHELAELQLQLATPSFSLEERAKTSDDEKLLLDQFNRSILVYTLCGALTFSAAKRLAKKLVGYAGYEVLLLDLMHMTFLDTSTALALEDIARNVRADKGKIVLACENPKVIHVLRSLNILAFIGEHKLLPSLKAAIEKSKVLLNEQDLHETNEIHK